VREELAFDDRSKLGRKPAGERDSLADGTEFQREGESLRVGLVNGGEGLLDEPRAALIVRRH
jgi:hypothetical protein